MSIPHGLEVDLQITNRCPLTCDHCVYDSRMTEGEGLPPAILPRLLDECVQLGVEQISITGGEPFVRDDLLDVVAMAAGRGFEVCVQTSGLLVDRIDFARVRDSGLDLLLVSIDGLSAYHEEFRHHRGLFDRALRTIEQAVGHGLPVRINTVVTRSNASQVVDLLPVAERLGVDVFSFFYLSPVGRGMHHQHEVLSFSEWQTVESAVRRWCLHNRRSDRMRIKVQNVATSLADIPPEGQQCRIKDRDNILILANGDVYPCVFLCHQPDLCLGNVVDDSLIRLWRSSAAWTDAYDPFFQLSGRDCRCGPANNCSGGCPAFRRLLRRADGHCDRRCEHATSGLAPGCAREYTLVQ